MDLYEYWNSFSDECDAFHVYAQKHLADFRTMFEQNKHGLYLKGSALNDEVLNLFYKHNILWTVAKSEDEKQKGLFIKNEVALFIPYTNFTVSETKIKQWFSSLSGKKYIPVVLTSNHIKNEKFMLNLINFVNNDNNFDVELPVNAAFYGYNSKTAGDVSLELLSFIIFSKEPSLLTVS